MTANPGCEVPGKTFFCVLAARKAHWPAGFDWPSGVVEIEDFGNDSSQADEGAIAASVVLHLVQFLQCCHIIWVQVRVNSYFLRKVSQNAPSVAGRFAGMSCFPMIPESRDRADRKGPAAMKKSPKAGCHKDARELALPT